MPRKNCVARLIWPLLWWLLVLSVEILQNNGLLFEGQMWNFNGCTFYFPGRNDEVGRICPPMARPVCYVYNGAVCCASYCPGRYIQAHNFTYAGHIWDLWPELKGLAILLTHTWKSFWYDLKAFLEDVKDNGMTKYSRDLHPHEKLVIT